MKRPTLGNQEIEVLRFIADRGPQTVGEVAREYGEPRGLARTTILTVMERLRKKGYLLRHREGGVFRYAAGVGQPDLLRHLVQEFVQKTLGGSLSPFIAYLAEAGDLEESEIEALRRIVAETEARKEEKP